MILQIMFFKVLELSIAASIIVLMVLLLRRVCVKMFTPRLIYCLWLIFILKLAIPISIPSPSSIENITDKYLYESVMNIGLNTTVNGLVKAQKAIGIYDSSKEIRKSQRVYKYGEVVVETKVITDPNMIELSRYDSSMHGLLNGFSSFWFIGFIIFITIKIYGDIRFKRFFIKNNYCEDEEIIKIFIQCKKEISIKKNIDLIMSGSTIPIIHGIFKPCILLPYDCKEVFTSEELRYILLHELQHYKQKDVILYCFGNILKAIHWFNPLIYLGIRKMEDDCEVLCDLHVMKVLKNEECINYGMLLIKQAEFNAANFTQSSVSASLFGNQSQLQLRIKKIVQYRPIKIRRKKYILGACIITLMSFILIPANNVYSYQRNYLDQKPTLYAFWFNENVELTNMNTINSMTEQIMGNKSTDKDVVLFMKNIEEVSIAKSKYPLFLEQIWPLSMFYSNQSIKINTKDMRNEIGKRKLRKGKIYIVLRCNFAHMKYFSTDVGKQALLDLESLDKLDKVKLY